LQVVEHAQQGKLLNKALPCAVLPAPSSSLLQMNAEELQSISGFYDQQCSWTVKSLKVNAFVHGLRQPRYVTLIDLVDHLGKSTQGLRGVQRGSKIYLADFNENTTKYRTEVLLPALYEVTRQAGFGIISGGYKKKKLYLPILCFRGVLYQKRKDKKDSSTSQEGEDGDVDDGNDNVDTDDSDADNGDGEQNGLASNELIVRRRTKTSGSPSTGIQSTTFGISSRIVLGICCITTIAVCDLKKSKSL
jgi:hypothetical protein